MTVQISEKHQMRKNSQKEAAKKKTKLTLPAIFLLISSKLSSSPAFKDKISTQNNTDPITFR